MRFIKNPSLNKDKQHGGLITAHCQNNHTYNLSTDSIFSNLSDNYFGLISQYPQDDDSEDVKREIRNSFQRHNSAAQAKEQEKSTEITLKEQYS